MFKFLFKYVISYIYIEKLAKIKKIKATEFAEIVSRAKDDISQFWSDKVAAISNQLPELQIVQPQPIDKCYNSFICYTTDEKIPISITKSKKLLKKNTTQATKKLQFIPNYKQRKLFDKCFRAHRFIYNQIVAYHRNNPDIYISRINLRKLVLDNLIVEHPWLKDIPYDTREAACNSYAGAYAAAMTNYRNSLAQGKRTKKPIMKFLNKKYTVDIFHVNNRAIINYNIFPRRLGKHSKLYFLKRDAEKLKELGSPQQYCIIRRERNGRYYIHIPFDKQVEVSNDTRDLVALDPGVRTFQSFYDGNNAGFLGDDPKKLIRKLQKRTDKMQSTLDTKKLNHKSRRTLKKRIAKLRSQIKNRIDNLHKQTAGYLVANYQNILLPTFRVKDMAQKCDISERNRDMYSLSHYRFKCYLKHAATTVHPPRTIIDCNESYTSKTCSNCGNIQNIKGDKLYACNHCPQLMDRDVNAAKNIYMRSVCTYIGGKTQPLSKKAC